MSKPNARGEAALAKANALAFELQSALTHDEEGDIDDPRCFMVRRSVAKLIKELNEFTQPELNKENR